MGYYEEMTDAIKQLKRYGSVASIDDFYLKAMQQSEGDTNAAGETSTTESAVDARVFDQITNITDGGLFYWGNTW